MSTATTPRIDPSWLAALEAQFGSPDMAKLRQFLLEEQRAGHEVYPPRRDIFAAFDRTPFDAVRVVIVGQDPYHGPGQAMGLSFSVPRGVRQPPSLRNVLAELETDLGLPRPEHGDLTHWADQGVLLLNSSLTVRAREAASHSGRGWEHLTDAAIRALSDGREHLVFLLWGSHARRKGASVDRTRHLVLEAAHPSPLSAHNGFFGCRHFSQANAYLAAHGQAPVDWSLPA
ncbi:MAG: uracil-DNA glycosylase [Thermoleophilia bacterium]|nr:uracil-DNA glycosylase [Thermoleophilia bacterium]